MPRAVTPPVIRISTSSQIQPRLHSPSPSRRDRHSAPGRPRAARLDSPSPIPRSPTSPPSFLPTAASPPPPPPINMAAVPRFTSQPVPPPLPPPTYLPHFPPGQDPGWQWGNDPNGADFGRPAVVKPGSSLLLGAASPSASSGRAGLPRTERGSVDILAPDASSSWLDARRGSSISTVTAAAGRTDDMGGNLKAEQVNGDDRAGQRTKSDYGLQSERQLGRWTLDKSSQSYDQQLLSRIGGPNTPKRQSTSSYTSTIPLSFDNSKPASHDRRHSSLLPLSVPARRHHSVDSPVTETWPSAGAASPAFHGCWVERDDAALEASTYARRPSTSRHGSLTFDESASHRGSYDSRMIFYGPDESPDFGPEEGQMSNLQLHDRSPASGSPNSKISSVSSKKRRASSPPRDREREDRSSVSSASSELIYPRGISGRSIQQLPPRGSPISRFSTHHSSLSSASSVGPRHGSLGSSLGFPSLPSSATSYASGRVSPSAAAPCPSPGQEVAIIHQSVSQQQMHQRTLSESTQGGLSVRKSSTDSQSHSRHGSLSTPQLHGVFICECCPKKPKKFEAQDELKLHESEKQYTCAYCPNRFKNKNEAERHQNSLHLRRHSWSCAALAGIEAAFHPSTSPPSSSSSSVDVCGYCGEEFPNPPQWDIRAEHVNYVHKFGECNQSKKFFRADHFRQHLKHSHHGAAGKWTNVLENACMKDEPLPEPRANATGAREGPPQLMITTEGLDTGHGFCGQGIAETPLDT